MNYFILILHFIEFLKFLDFLDKTTQNFSPTKLFTMLFSCLNLSMYSTNTSFYSWLVFIILDRDSVHDRYRCIARIGSSIDLSIASIRFIGLLIILSYLGCSLILVCVWLGQNSLNIIAYAFFTFSFSFFLFSRDYQFLYSTLIWKTRFLIPPCLVHLLSISFQSIFPCLNLKYLPCGFILQYHFHLLIQLEYLKLDAPSL